jgi:hypothetical protein
MLENKYKDLMAVFAQLRDKIDDLEKFASGYAGTERRGLRMFAAQARTKMHEAIHYVRDMAECAANAEAPAEAGGGGDDE